MGVRPSTPCSWKGPRPRPHPAPESGRPFPLLLICCQAARLGRLLTTGFPPP